MQIKQIKQGKQSATQTIYEIGKIMYKLKAITILTTNNTKNHHQNTWNEQYTF